MSSDHYNPQGHAFAGYVPGASPPAVEISSAPRLRESQQAFILQPPLLFMPGRGAMQGDVDLIDAYTVKMLKSFIALLCIEK